MYGGKPEFTLQRHGLKTDSSILRTRTQPSAPADMDCEYDDVDGTVPQNGPRQPQIQYKGDIHIDPRRMAVAQATAQKGDLTDSCDSGLCDSGVGDSYKTPQNSDDLTQHRHTCTENTITNNTHTVHLGRPAQDDTPATELYREINKLQLKDQDPQTRGDSGALDLHLPNDELNKDQAELLFDDNLPTDLPNKTPECRVIKEGTHTEPPHIEFRIPQITQHQRNIFSQDADWDTQLHIAIAQGQTGIVIMMIKLAPSHEYLNLRNKLGQTPTHVAALTSQPEIVRKLMCWGADVEIVDRNGNNPIHLSCEVGCLGTLWQLTQPITEKDIEGVPYPVPDRGIPDINAKNYEGYSALHTAAAKGFYNIVEYLAAIGANMNNQDGKSGRTPLHHAVEAGHYDMCRKLLQCGANVDARAYDGSTPLRLAIGHNNNQIIDLLQAKGACLSAANIDSDSESEDDSMDGSYDDFMIGGKPV